ncbi:MAG: hypothetical protein AAGM84_05475 [Pseudomonadota bacterium]
MSGSEIPAHLTAVEIEEGGVRVDLFPIAEDVIRNVPGAKGFDADQLAQLTRESYFGAYVRVTKFPKGADTKFYRMLMGRVVAWSRWERKREAIAYAATATLRNMCHVIQIGEECCDAMRSRNGEIADPANPERLPLNECLMDCGCRYAFRKIE